MKYLVLVAILAGGLFAMSWWDARQREIRAGLENGFAAVGMTRDQVVMACGQPSATAASSGITGQTLRLTYPSGQVITLKNGRVVAIQGAPANTDEMASTGEWIGHSAPVGGARPRTAKRNTGPTMSATETEARKDWGWPKEGTSLSRGAYR